MSAFEESEEFGEFGESGDLGEPVSAAWIEAATLGPETAHATWALAARQVLEGVATDYHAFVTVPDLAGRVQERSRIRTRAKPGTWMGDVLFRVAQDCHRTRSPLLNALCVQPGGTMGGWYADTVLTVRGDAVTDPEQHAAEERLDCYRVFGAVLPDGGGVPALARPAPAARAPRAASGARSASPRPRAVAVRKPARKEPDPPKVCPSCFMALPATGVCDMCD